MTISIPDASALAGLVGQSGGWAGTLLIHVGDSPTRDMELSARRGNCAMFTGTPLTTSHDVVDERRHPDVPLDVIVAGAHEGWAL